MYIRRDLTENLNCNQRRTNEEFMGLTIMVIEIFSIL